MTEEKISQKLTFSGLFERVERLIGHFSVAQSRSSNMGMGVSCEGGHGWRDFWDRNEGRAAVGCKKVKSERTHL